MTDRRPSLPVAKPHPLEASAAAASRAATAPHTSTPPTTDERAITDQLNVRIRRDTNQRLERASLLLGAQRGQKTSKVAVVEEALQAYFELHDIN